MAESTAAMWTSAFGNRYHQQVTPASALTSLTSIILKMMIMTSLTSIILRSGRGSRVRGSSSLRHTSLPPSPSTGTTHFLGLFLEDIFRGAEMFSHPGHAHLQTDPYTAAGSLHCFQSSPQVSQTLWKKNEQKINVQNSFGASFGYEQVRREVYGRAGGRSSPSSPGSATSTGSWRAQSPASPSRRSSCAADWAP